MSNLPSEEKTYVNVVKKIPDKRRQNKQQMERKRRARINDCLDRIKLFVLEAMKKNPSEYDKLEKADILELAVNYLQTVQMPNAAGNSQLLQTLMDSNAPNSDDNDDSASQCSEEDGHESRNKGSQKSLWRPW